MQPINKPLTELVNEGYKLLESISIGLKVYYKGKERVFYDRINEQVLWKYTSEYDVGKELENEKQ